MAKKTIRLKKHRDFIQNCEFSDLKVFDVLLKSIPKNTQLQLSNSAVIRYSQLFDIKKEVNVFCNRGTSGIDGSTSSAIGAASVVKENTVFLTGDISFFYDSNAFWNNHVPSNLKVLLINNGGGNIFKVIRGPENTKQLESLFVTKQNAKAEKKTHQ